MTAIPPVINFPAWIDENQHLLKPPVGNKQLYQPTGDFIVMVVGGPNQRTDFHLDPYEEWFYQVRGNMHLNLMTDEGAQRVAHPRGRDVDAAAQHPALAAAARGGLDRPRRRADPRGGHAGEVQWYCPNCDAKVHEVELQVRDIVADLPPVFEAFYTDEKARTCAACGTLHPGKG